MKLNLIREVYRNLISNASKYSPAGAAIELKLHLENGKLVSQVIDQGMGIPRADRPKIFQRFFRASNTEPGGVKGTGLGLYLSKIIVEVSGGKIWFASKLGKGTSFVFELPAM